MFTSRNFKAPLLFSASLLLLQSHASAQSGRKPSTPKPVPGMQTAPRQTPVDYTRYDKVRVLVSRGLDVFVKALNEQGRLGYRLEKTVSYDGPEEPRRYAAVLHLDPGHTYEYVSELMPEDARYGDPINRYPSRGYSFVHAYARTLCVKSEGYDANDPPGSPVRQETQALKSNALLFMRRDAVETQTKEYKTFKSRFTLEGGQKKELQAALNAAPPGFRPVRFLFSAGPYVFNVTVLAERDLNEAAPPKVEYELVKEVFGFEDEVNRLAAAGARYVGGGRNESVKFVLMAREAADATTYTFKDPHQHRKEFPGMLAAGNSYVGLLAGDLTCDYEVMGQKLVFARGAAGASPGEYKILEISDRGPGKKKINGLLPGASVSELQRLLADGFRVRELFHTYGLYAVLERQAEPPAPQVQTSER